MNQTKRNRFHTVRCAILWLCCALPVATASAESGYRAYTDWVGWARLHFGKRAGLASSYDRAGFNLDFSQYESPPGVVQDGSDAILKTISGPGVIYRFWMPHKTASVENFPVRMYIDNEATPRIDTDSLTILGGNYGYFSAPLVDTFAGGQVCYEPVFFNESIRIETTTEAANHYYQFSYMTFSPGSSVDSYSGSLAPQEQADRDAVVALFANAGQHPAGQSSGSVSVPTAASSIPAGGSLSLFTSGGPGIVRRLNIRMDSATDGELDGLNLVVTYDSDPAPAIDIPVSQFFGAGHQRALYKSLPMGTDSPDGFYCYWPMPFRNGISIELLNTTAAAIPIDSAIVEYEPTSVGREMCYLRALAVTHIRQSGDIHHPILTVAGRGHYVGSHLYVEQPSDSFRMLEGDDIVTVDGTDTLYGTGLEDAYNGGFYYNWVAVLNNEPEGPMPQSASRPLNGILYVHREDGVPNARADQYRWCIADRIPFCSSIDVKIENQYAVIGSEWTSVAFWYQQPAGDIPGDLDNNGGVDPADLTLFVQVLLALDTLPDHLVAADVNTDCTVDGNDIPAFVNAMMSP